IIVHAPNVEIRKLSSGLLIPSLLRYFGGNVGAEAPTVEFKEVMGTEDGVKRWTGHIRETGFCFVNNCPLTSADTQALVERIAFIRPTHYGGFWRFTSDLASKDTAYTSLALAAHTDTTYFTDPAGLQTFHLLSHTKGSGGTSLLVDGFKAAEILRSESPEAFQDLCRIKFRGHSSGNEGIAIKPTHAFPVITAEPDRSGQNYGRSEVTQIRWNNDDRAAMFDLDPETVSKFYAAARKWVEILRRPELENWVQLIPGKVLSKCRGIVLGQTRARRVDMLKLSTIGESYMADQHSLAKGRCVELTV
ncbi:MAG: hypothetical protein Q9174_004945, partial [Haloplaca sp. 1 TL-2023]